MSVASEPSSAPGRAAIRPEGLRMAYGALVAVDNLSLDIAEGEFLTFLGPSGCGKTTTLRMIAGFVIPDRGVAADHSAICRWEYRFAPEMEKRLRWQWRRPQSASSRVDETYVKMRGQWAYLYRALDKLGNTIDFYLSATRNTKAAKPFLGKALRGLKKWGQPEVLNTDKAPTYAAAIASKSLSRNPSTL